MSRGNLHDFRTNSVARRPASASRYRCGSNGRRGRTVTVWVTVLVSVLVLGTTVEVPVLVLDGGVTVWVTVSVAGAELRACVVVVVAVVVGEGVLVSGAGEPSANLTTATITAASNAAPTAPDATSAGGRRYHGVGGSGPRSKPPPGAARLGS
jgi:hypothetical protein